MTTWLYKVVEYDWKVMFSGQESSPNRDSLTNALGEICQYANEQGLTVVTVNHLPCHKIAGNVSFTNGIVLAVLLEKPE